MFDINHLNQYKENNCLEVKLAAGGLPKSIWETYSSFANTEGGIILLGVSEKEDGGFVIEGLENPEKLQKEIWNTLYNTQKVSRNILSSRHVEILNIQKKQIIRMTVPRADRRDKPIYIGANPFTGTFRRSGDGDYHCTTDEVKTMLRDQGDSESDITIIEGMDLDVIDYDTLSRYRNRMKINLPGHVWEDFDDVQFMLRIGAAGRSNDGVVHPTVAGLLMFGKDYEINREFPEYFLDYREVTDMHERWSDRICSGTGEWSGNIYDFFFRVYNRLIQDIRVPFEMKNGLERITDTPLHKAMREVLANCVIHADYRGRQGVVIVKRNNEISLSNPGSFRIDIRDAVVGGVSDPRNGTILKMFNLINIGERAGSGVPLICKVWYTLGWEEPEFKESFHPERTTVRLRLNQNKNAYVNSGSLAGTRVNEPGVSYHIQTQRNTVLNYLSTHDCITTTEVMSLLNLSATQGRKVLRDLAEDGILISLGHNKNRRYVKAPALDRTDETIE